MADREAPGDFDYLPGTEADGAPAPSSPTFDAFDPHTWYFEPAPPPWYRTKPAMTALTATAVAAAAIVVSGVLLVLRGPAGTVDESVPDSTAAPTTIASSARATDPEPPPPAPAAPAEAPPPAPPAEESAEAPVDAPAETLAPAPAQTVRRSAPTRTTKEPEIGVTRTPVTRSPISVAPQLPGGAPGR
ncbi:hypothetical protein [Mycolicibacterium sp. XJ1819]